MIDVEYSNPILSLIHKNFALSPLFFKNTHINSDGIVCMAYDLTPLFLVTGLVAFSFIIMSVCNYVIDLFNKLSLARKLDKMKKDIVESKEDDRKRDKIKPTVMKSEEK